jgi:hypothetical protein
MQAYLDWEYGLVEVCIARVQGIEIAIPIGGSHEKLAWQDLLQRPLNSVDFFADYSY